MTKLSGALFAATMSLTLAALLANAQSTSKTPAKPSTPAPATAAPAASKGEKCACPSCAAGEPAAHGGGKQPGMQGGMMMDCPMHAEHECPLQQVAAIADIKVETTKLGATLQLVAKNPIDAEKVRQLARDAASHLSTQPHHAH
jgi:hypothetical protein